VIQQRTEPYIRVCMKTWLLCESAIHTEMKRREPRHGLIQACTECARICFSLVSQLVSDQAADDSTGPMAFDCWLSCRQCADACFPYIREEDFQLCAEACVDCSEELKDIFRFNLN